MNNRRLNQRVVAIKVAIDAMGGDHGVETTVPATLQALRQHAELAVILVGDQAVVEQACQTHGLDLTAYADRLTLQHASEVVAMDESPAKALKSKKDSSMRVALNLVKEGKADACVSAGNTGALMATARFVLRMLPCIDRPAILAALPTRSGGRVRMLDAGANVDTSPAQLFQFAVMGTIAVQAVDDIATPRVGLLNIGHEAVKGNNLVKATASLLEESDVLNYCGFIESDSMFSDKVDLVVCDGFVGNAVLKACEGTARMIFHTIKTTLRKNLINLCLTPFVKLGLSDVAKAFDPCRYNGALLLGLQGVVIKSHGGATAKAFKHAIATTLRVVDHQVPQQIGQRLSDQAIVNQAE